MTPPPDPATVTPRLLGGEEPEAASERRGVKEDNKLVNLRWGGKSEAPATQQTLHTHTHTHTHTTLTVS